MDHRKCRKLIKAMRSECVWMSVCLVAAHPVHTDTRPLNALFVVVRAECSSCHQPTASTVTERVKLSTDLTDLLSNGRRLSVDL